MKLPSPIESIELPLLQEKGVKLSVKRDDLIHPLISGNKWRKLKLNIEQFKAGGYQHLLTFGGAYSNHIAATAKAGKILDIPTIGIIRGDELNERSNETLKRAAEDGMKLIFTERQEYALRDEKYYHEELRRRHGHIWIVPEGGKNFYGMLGCVEILDEISEPYSHVITAAGTGTTASGLVYGTDDKQIIAVSALKNGDFLKDEIQQMLKQGGWSEAESVQALKRLNLLTDYHFGGYAKKTDQLIRFMNDFYETTKIKLDYIYTAKMFFALLDLIQSNHFKKGSHIIAIHTGGLQGNTSIKEQLLY